jgi:type IV pilus assembly protein PilM
MSVFGRTRTVVGLDIGSSAVKAVELRPSGRTYRVVAFGSEPVPPDTIVDGAIIDGGAVADVIRGLFESRHIKSREVAASLSGNAVIVKKISLPVMSDAELSESIYWEAEQYIPFDIQDVNLDYQIVSPGSPGDSRGAMEVLLVAAKKEKIADYTSVITQAGRVPVVVDVDAFAMQNAYEVNYELQPGRMIALLNVGASAININIVNGDQSVFTRDISSAGGNAFTEAVQKELNLPFESAEQAKTTGAERIDHVLLAGGASRVYPFQEMLSERVGAPVEPFDPFRKVQFESRKFGVDDVTDVAPTAVVAVGLALRRAGDR